MHDGEECRERTFREELSWEKVLNSPPVYISYELWVEFCFRCNRNNITLISQPEEMMKFISSNYRLAELNENTECFYVAVSCSSTKLDSCSGWLSAEGGKQRVEKPLNGNHLNFWVDQFLHDCGRFVCFDRPQLNRFPVRPGNISTCCSCLRARDESLVMPK